MLDAALFVNGFEDKDAAKDTATSWSRATLMKNCAPIGKDAGNENLYPRAELARRVAKKVKLNDSMSASLLEYLKRVEREIHKEK